MIKRTIERSYLTSLEEFPITGIIGPRQIGKTTLVKQAEGASTMLYLDLERTSDLGKLSDPELFLTQHTDKTVILDEVQHLPELFPPLRSLVDDNRRPGRFVVLGSASPVLLRQSSESLAGRINYWRCFRCHRPRPRDKSLRWICGSTVGFLNLHCQKNRRSSKRGTATLSKATCSVTCPRTVFRLIQRSPGNCYK